jgi:hypothetical protein
MTIIGLLLVTFACETAAMTESEIKQAISEYGRDEAGAMIANSLSGLMPIVKKNMILDRISYASGIDTFIVHGKSSMIKNTPTKKESTRITCRNPGNRMLVNNGYGYVMVMEDFNNNFIGKIAVEPYGCD